MAGQGSNTPLTPSLLLEEWSPLFLLFLFLFLLHVWPRGDT